MIRNLEPSAARGIASSIGSIHGLAGQVENYSGTTVSVKVGNGSVVHGGTVSDSTVSGIGAVLNGAHALLKLVRAAGRG